MTLTHRKRRRIDGVRPSPVFLPISFHLTRRSQADGEDRAADQEPPLKKVHLDDVFGRLQDQLRVLVNTVQSASPVCLFHPGTLI